MATMLAGRAPQGLGGPLLTDAEAAATYAPIRGFDVKAYGATGDGVTDDSNAVQAAIAACYTAGGGVVHFPAGDYVISEQLVIPNDGGVGNPHSSPRQPTMILQGEGGWVTGQQQTTDRVVGGTVLHLSYTNATYNMAKIVTRGLGSLTLRDLTLTEPGTDTSTPFLFTTLTTLDVSHCAFHGGYLTAWTQDAIVLGGVTKPSMNGHADDYSVTDSAFQGYGTVIRNCYFDKVRRVVYGRSYCNHAIVRDNFVDKGCGSELAGGACIEFNGGLDVVGGQADSDNCTANVVTGNYLNGLGYVYQVKVVRGYRNVVAFNGSPDPQPDLVALVRVEQASDGVPTVHASADNFVIGNFRGDAITHLSEDTDSAGLNWCFGDATVDGSRLVGPLSTGRYQIAEPTGAPANPWTVDDTTTATWVSLSNGPNPTFVMNGPLQLNGNGIGAGTTRLTLGNGATDDDSVFTLAPGTGKSAQVQFKQGGTNSWLFYDAASALFYIRDSVNSKMHVTLTPGAGTGGATEFNSAVKVNGDVGFYGTTPVAQQTVAVPNVAAIHTALVNLGLITT